jgi:hypothetical protein
MDGVEMTSNMEELPSRHPESCFNLSYAFKGIYLPR